MLLTLIVLLVGCRSPDPSPPPPRRVVRALPPLLGETELVTDEGQALLTLSVIRRGEKNLELVLSAKDVAVPQVSVQLELQGPSNRSHFQLVWFGDMQPGDTAIVETYPIGYLGTILDVGYVLAETKLGDLTRKPAGDE